MTPAMAARAPFRVLEALRRYADRPTVFVQAGRIAVPRPQQFLLSYLDDSIIEAAAPTRGGLFHPKVAPSVRGPMTHPSDIGSPA